MASELIAAPQTGLSASERVQMFELAQRKAKMYSSSTLVPERYSNNPANCMIALNIAERIGADELMVMQNLYVVHGTPGWSAQFLIASFNNCGRFAPIRYEMQGTPGQAKSSCTAISRDLATGEEIRGEPVTWEMVCAEKWNAKNGSKWLTMPGQMFRYRAAAFLVRTTAPEIAIGMQTREELDDYLEGEIVETPKHTGRRPIAPVGLPAPEQEAVIDPEPTDSPKKTKVVFATCMAKLRGAKTLAEIEEAEDWVRNGDCDKWLSNEDNEFWSFAEQKKNDLGAAK